MDLTTLIQLEPSDALTMKELKNILKTKANEEYSNDIPKKDLNVKLLMTSFSVQKASFILIYFTTVCL